MGALGVRGWPMVDDRRTRDEQITEVAEVVVSLAALVLLSFVLAWAWREITRSEPSDTGNALETAGI
jgi:hypothetical protein